jgi:predicted O-methyltransferase YrrM
MTVRLKDRFECLSLAAKLAPAEGLVLEFGVAGGASINHLARQFRGRTVHGFDSFAGLPEPWGTTPAGTFACAPPQVAPNVVLVIGMFADTLPLFLAMHLGPAALVHLDADLYSSTKTVLDLLTLRIEAGTVIAFDEWFATEHEPKAFGEWLTAQGRSCRHVAETEQQRVVIITL